MGWSDVHFGWGAEGSGRRHVGGQAAAPTERASIRTRRPNPEGPLGLCGMPFGLCRIDLSCLGASLHTRPRAEGEGPCAFMELAPPQHRGLAQGRELAAHPLLATRG